ncbi:MAG: GNAT family N-acetyltransferase [Candidatus Rokubacteria bacterium]|nr:GNAT family N-acetyltransferase [Candidatus Rokubacteria bacterium]MBI3826766.1 GNAT family N-acetyltransferase [Candidatus Rokubacteria bacterium]
MTAPGAAPTLTTARLRLRDWTERDLAPFAALNADARVMEFFPRPLDRAESDALAARIRDHFARRGFGLWAVEAPGAADFIGFVGLSVPTFQAPFTPCVEVGWRLAAAHWGRGYATEAAAAVVAHGFRQLGLDEIVSFTVPANVRSRRVMDRLGMTRRPVDDFDNPMLPPGHPQRPHVLYRLPRTAWEREGSERRAPEPTRPALEHGNARRQGDEPQR